MFTKFFSRGISVAFVALTLAAFATALFFSGCGADDNPIVDEHEHEEDAPYHAEADGFVLEVDGVEVYRQFQGTETGGITVGVGEEIDVHVQFLNPDGAVFTPMPEGEEEEEDAHGHDEEEAFALGLTGYDTAIAEVHLHVEEHEEDEHGHVEGEEDAHEEEEEKWVFEVVGVKAGTTHISLQLLHGDHPDFTAALRIPITVQ